MDGRSAARDTIRLGGEAYVRHALAYVPSSQRTDSISIRSIGRGLHVPGVANPLRETLAEPGADVDVLASARRRIDALKDAEADQLGAAKLAMPGTKAVVRADIARFERDQAQAPTTALRGWLTSLLRRYEAWLARLSPP
jgi:hypothetical protein